MIFLEKALLLHMLRGILSSKFLPSLVIQLHNPSPQVFFRYKKWCPMCLQRGITLEIAWVTFLRPELTFVVDWVLNRHIRCLCRWLFLRARGFGGGGGGEVRRVIPRLCHFFFQKWSYLVRIDSAFSARISPQWLSELRSLWTSVS